MNSSLSYDLSSKREAQLFAFSLAASEPQLAEAERVLNAEELARANRFVHADVRRRFIVCRSRLRHLLARELGISAAQVEFRYEQWGKPQLRQSVAADLQFNVSHSGDWGLIVLARVAVGVDLELLNDRFEYRGIATQILSSRERTAWERLPPAVQANETLRLWVCKEALLKAMGLGIAEGLQQVSFPIPLPSHGEAFSPESISGVLQMRLEDDGTCARNHWIDSRAWRLQLLDMLPNCHMAVCLPAGVQLVYPNLNFPPI
ncbi:MAG: 4'-phosphopantetheinyl transferase superfamily protein [Pirellulaceae bacterium]|jgi:phosphopantetheinyl transferase|nr:4'-phosphopantetheinyl transferase superfamily protein [Pirellulaceae bacterium]